ncbi:Sua5/YciO/YrdC/YwlC family protein [Nocardia jiangxiensis]|uniref:Sua5/YciO/YrdC/YwlC family protein n=1 Tax=Nocardia jiangxiensis TaxID=282685 RepID=A0ABW6S5E7_9NOCA
MSSRIRVVMVHPFAAADGLVVTPTKVGYILIATDGAGLERKFEAKQRNRGKPGVVLCASLAQLAELAELNDEIAEFYRKHWDSVVVSTSIGSWRIWARASRPGTTVTAATTETTEPRTGHDRCGEVQRRRRGIRTPSPRPRC